MSNTSKPKIIVIVGPTASGKTGLSIEIAQRFNGEVISADSRQVYRGLDIGTEKVTPAEMLGVPHHLLDVVDLDTVYTAADFTRDAAAAILAIQNRGRLPIIAGGTAFYIDTLLGKITAPEVPPNPLLRTELEAATNEALLAKLKLLDPERAETIDKDNPRRLIRAIEIATALGRVPTTTVRDCPYDALVIGIAVPKDELRARLRARAARALERGLIQETEHLIANGISEARLREIGLEYPLVLDYLKGEIDQPTLLQKLEEKNWQYAKRQLTWLKRDKTISWVHSDSLTIASSLVANFLKLNNKK